MSENKLSQDMSDVGRVTIGMPSIEDFDWVMSKEPFLQRFLHIGVFFKDLVGEADGEISIIHQRISALETHKKYTDLTTHCSIIMLRQLPGVPKEDTLKAYANLVGKSLSAGERTEYKVICNETNNPPEAVDRGELIVDVEFNNDV